MEQHTPAPETVQELKDKVATLTARVAELEKKLAQSIPERIVDAARERLVAFGGLLKKGWGHVSVAYKHEKEERAVRRSLRRLAAQASWPRSTMQPFFAKEFWMLATTPALKRYAVDKAVRALPRVAKKGYAVFDFAAALSAEVKKDASLKIPFVVAGTETFTALAKASPAAAENLFKSLMDAAGDNKDLKGRVLNAAVDAIPVIARRDNRLSPVLPSFIAGLRKVLGEDPKTPVVYKEFAISAVNPASNHATLVVRDGDKWWHEPIVESGCFKGLSGAFARAVAKKYPDAASVGRKHYDTVLNFIGNAYDIMGAQPSLRDALSAKINGAPAVTGAPFPVR